MRTVIHNGQVFDGVAKGVRAATVVIDEETISEIIDGHVDIAADVAIDATGRTVMPGLINVHAHLSFMYSTGHPNLVIDRDDASLYAQAFRMTKVLLAQGITFVRDMGGPRNIHVRVRDLIKSGLILGPEVMACGSPLVAYGRHAFHISEEADGPDGVVKAVRNQFKLGADFIKLMASDDPVPCTSAGVYTTPGFSEEEIRAAYSEVRRHERLACCHVMGEESIRVVLDAGADIIDHGHYLTPELAQRLVRDGIYLTPTISSYDKQTMHPRFDRGAEWAAKHAPLLEGHVSSVRAAVDAGVKMLIGTDTVGCFAEEVDLLRQAGMSADDTLLAATRWAAEALRVGDRMGSLQAGKLANIAIVGAGVHEDAYALEDVSDVLLRGVRLSPERLVENEVLASSNLWELARSPR